MTQVELSGSQPYEDQVFKSSVVVKALLVPGGPGAGDQVLVYSEDQAICFETADPSVLALFQPGEQSIYLFARWHARSNHLLILRERPERQDW